MPIQLHFRLEAPNFAAEHWRQQSVAFQREFQVLLDGWQRRIEREAKAAAPGGPSGSIAADIKTRFAKINDSIQLLLIGGQKARWMDLGTGIRSIDPLSPKTFIEPLKEGGWLKIPIRGPSTLEEMQFAHQADPVGKNLFQPVVFVKQQKGMAPTRFMTGLWSKYEREIQVDILNLAKKHGFQ